MFVSSRLPRPLAAVVLGAALLAPFQTAATASAASPAASSTVHPVAAARATQATLTAYHETDRAGAIQLSGSLRWADGNSLGRAQHVSLWGKAGGVWKLVAKADTDSRGAVAFRVAKSAVSKYQLRYAGSFNVKLSSTAAPSVSPSVRVPTAPAAHAVARITLKAPAQVRRGETFAVVGTVTPAGAGRIVTLAGNGTTFTTLRTRADGSFAGHVRLRSTTTLSAVLPDTAGLDGAVSGPHLVRVTG